MDVKSHSRAHPTTPPQRFSNIEPLKYLLDLCHYGVSVPPGRGHPDTDSKIYTLAQIDMYAPPLSPRYMYTKDRTSLEKAVNNNQSIETVLRI